MTPIEVLLMIFSACLSSALAAFGFNSALECKRREAAMFLTIAGGVSSLGILVIVEHFTSIMLTLH